MLSLYTSSAPTPYLKLYFLYMTYIFFVVIVIVCCLSSSLKGEERFLSVSLIAET
jgi:hypothetical protein